MNKGGAKHFLKDSAASGLSLLARTAEQLLMVPILLGAWSVQLFGEWTLIATVPTYLALSDLGFIQAGSNELARRSGIGEEDSARRFYAQFSATVLWASSAGMAVLAVLVLISPISQWLHLQTMTAQQTAQVFLLLIAGALVAQNNLGVIAGMRSRRLYHLGLLAQALGSLARLAGAVVVVYGFGAGPVGLAAVLLLVRVGEYGLNFVFLVRQGLRPQFWLPGIEVKEPMLPYMLIGLEFMLFPLALAVELQGAMMVVGLTSGAVAVAAFAAHRTMTRMTAQIVRVGLLPLRAELGLLQGEAHRAQMSQMLLTVSRVTFWLSIFTAAGLMLVAAPLFRIWTHDKVGFAPLLFGLLLLVSMLDGVWQTIASVRLSTNRQRPIAWGYLIAAVIGLVALYLLGDRLGLVGIALPLIAISFSMIVLSIITTAPLLDLSAGAYIRGLFVFPRKELAMLVHALTARLKR